MSHTASKICHDKQNETTPMSKGVIHKFLPISVQGNFISLCNLPNKTIQVHYLSYAMLNKHLLIPTCSQSQDQMPPTQFQQ